MADTQHLLDEALAARHAWRTGKTRTSWTIGDQSFGYSVEGMRHLDAYIAELRRKLNPRAGARSRNRVRYVVPD